MHSNVCAWTPNWLSVTQGDTMWQTKLSEGGKTLVLTIWSDKTQLLTVEQASQLTVPDFSKLWKVRSETYRLSLSERQYCIIAIFWLLQRDAFCIVGPGWKPCLHALM